MARPDVTDVVTAIPKVADLETHVRRIMVDGVEAVELRDYLVSLDEYGRGYWFPGDTASIQRVIDALVSVVNQR